MFKSDDEIEELLSLQNATFLPDFSHEFTASGLQVNDLCAFPPLKLYAKKIVVPLLVMATGGKCVVVCRIEHWGA